jgi:hypothetical protein
MGKRTRSLIKGIAIVLVLISVFLEMDILNFSLLEPYKYWMAILGFGFLLLVSK